MTTRLTLRLRWCPGSALRVPNLKKRRSQSHFRSHFASTLTRKRDSLVEEQRIVRSRPIDQPVHGRNHILSRRDLPRVPSIVRQDDNVLLFIPKPVTQEFDHVVRIVDTASEGLRGPDVVAADGERFTFPVTLGVLEERLLTAATLVAVLELRSVELVALRRSVCE